MKNLTQIEKRAKGDVDRRHEARCVDLAVENETSSRNRRFGNVEEISNPHAAQTPSKMSVSNCFLGKDENLKHKGAILLICILNRLLLSRTRAMWHVTRDSSVQYREHVRCGLR